jgi:hypothetical protein
LHFVVSWELRSQGNRRLEINNAMMEGLYGYSWLRLLSSFYILDIDSERDWNVIHERLLSAAVRFKGEVNFLMSPIYDFDSDYFVYEMPEKDFYQS